MIFTSQQIKLRLKYLGVRTDKYLGQHFLIDANVLATIIDTTKDFIDASDTIVEAGPGLGVLTEELLKLGNPVVAVEKDPILANALSEFLNAPANLNVIKGDILDFVPTVVPENKPWVFVANIPYGITSPLLRKLVARRSNLRHILILAQKEVAQRVCAKPGNSSYGLLSLLTQAVALPKIVQLVPKNCFWPEPKVDSAILRIDLDGVNPTIDEAIMPTVLTLATAGFANKRKQLANSLAGGLSIDIHDVKILLTTTKIEPSRRAETLTLDEWTRLALRYKKWLADKSKP